MKIPIIPFLFALVLIQLHFSACSPKWKETPQEDFILVENEGGQNLGYSQNSGIKIITADRFAFKDLNRNGPIQDERNKFYSTKQ